MKYLFALDFDFTTIDEDSDQYVFSQLSPALHEKMQSLTSKFQWTDLMDLLINELQDTGITTKIIAETLATIPFVY